jgi:hypothetical protein
MKKSAHGVLAARVKSAAAIAVGLVVAAVRRAARPSRFREEANVPAIARNVHIGRAARAMRAQAVRVPAIPADLRAVPQDPVREEASATSTAMSARVAKNAAMNGHAAPGQRVVGRGVPQPKAVRSVPMQTAR